MQSCTAARRFRCMLRRRMQLRCHGALLARTAVADEAMKPRNRWQRRAHVPVAAVWVGHCGTAARLWWCAVLQPRGMGTLFTADCRKALTRLSRYAHARTRNVREWTPASHARRSA